MYPKRFQNGCQFGNPSFLEEPLNRLFMKMLPYQIRPCLRMFAAHLVAKINIFVIRGCNIGANIVPNAHAENGVTFNRKVSKMISKCVPEGVPETHKRQYQTVISDFGRALVSVLRPPPWSWILTAALGAGCRPKGVLRGWSISLEWHTHGSPARHFWRIAVLFNPRDFGTTHCRHHFWDIVA